MIFNFLICKNILILKKIKLLKKNIIDIDKMINQNYLHIFLNLKIKLINYKKKLKKIKNQKKIKKNVINIQILLFYILWWKLILINKINECQYLNLIKYLLCYNNQWIFHQENLSKKFLILIKIKIDNINNLKNIYKNNQLKFKKKYKVISQDNLLKIIMIKQVFKSMKHILHNKKSLKKVYKVYKV